MALEEILEKLFEKVPQAIGVILIDQEGEAVRESCQGNPTDLRILAAHTGIILARLGEMQTSVSTGEISEGVITSRDGHIIFGPIDREYALVMQTGPGGAVAQSVYHFRQAMSELKRGF